MQELMPCLFSQAAERVKVWGRAKQPPGHSPVTCLGFTSRSSLSWRSSVITHKPIGNCSCLNWNCILVAVGYRVPRSWFHMVNGPTFQESEMTLHGAMSRFHFPWVLSSAWSVPYPLSTSQLFRPLLLNPKVNQSRFPSCHSTSNNSFQPGHFWG